MSGFLQRLLSPRVRELERELERVSRDWEAMREGEFEKVSITQMVYTPENGLQCQLETNIAKLLAAWAFNVLKVVDAKNFVEFQVRHPEAGSILITVQRARGETPGAKAARLERELQVLNRDGEIK